MQQKKFKTACLGLCDQKNGFCSGCGRSEQEVQQWFFMTEAQRQAVLQTVREDFKIPVSKIDN